MGIQDQAIQRMWTTADELLPLQKEEMRFGIDAARTAFEQSQQDRDWSLGRRAALTGVQDQLVSDADRFNAAQRGDELAAAARADVVSAADRAQAASARSMARMGVMPGSGKWLMAQGGLDVARAAAEAGASNNARAAGRQEGYALTDRAANALAGYPAMAMQATGAGAAQGMAGLTVANAGLSGMNSGYGSAAGVAGQMGTNATGMWGAQANYKSAQDRLNQSDAGGTMAGLGAVLGGVAKVAPLFMSDRRLKEGIKRVGADERTGLTLYEFSYRITPDRRQRFVGVMADEVERVMPGAVHRDALGYASVDYGMLGIEFRRVR
jgi:hypothetical protein